MSTCRSFLIASACLFAAPSGAATVDFSTLVQWTSGAGANGHYYALTAAPSSWTDAYAAALAVGGDLASINSAEENAFMGTAFGFDNMVSTIYWIGYRRTSPGGAFAWTDGSAVGYTNFNAGEPNNANGNELYTALNWYGFNGPGGVPSNIFGTWNDTPDNGVFYANPAVQPYVGIVEFALNPLAVPEPATWAMLIGGFALTGGVLRRRVGSVRFA